MITEEQREWLRAQLVERRDEVVRELEWQRKADRATGSEDQDDAVDRAEMELERALEHRRENDAVHLLQKINFALRRLEEGGYESCQRCGAPISWERLQARPYVSLCHNCQQDKEDGQTVEAPR